MDLTKAKKVASLQAKVDTAKEKMKDLFEGKKEASIVALVFVPKSKREEDVKDIGLDIEEANLVYEALMDLWRKKIKEATEKIERL